jgi:hypothetical protein
MSILTAYDKFIQVALKYAFSLFGLPKTGVTIVNRAGDDGTYQKGYPKSGARFTDNGDGTITDMATGLMWVKDGTGVGCNNGVSTLWDNAIDFCNNLNFAGHTDWRLPNVRELASIAVYGREQPAIDPLFTHTDNVFHWTSTSYIGDNGNAWYVNFIFGWVYIGTKAALTARIRPVRG